MADSLRRRLKRLERLENPGLAHGWGVPQEEIEAEWAEWVSELCAETGLSREEVERELDEELERLRQSYG